MFLTVLEPKDEQNIVSRHPVRKLTYTELEGQNAEFKFADQSLHAAMLVVQSC
ncbi:hypothetical protein N9D38_02815 [Rubripirellula sp.]|jgi:hypothetical protein|nr:hypothetical protein [Rubripirellula sp.]